MYFSETITTPDLIMFLELAQKINRKRNQPKAQLSNLKMTDNVFKPFSELKITTMTSVAKFEGTINLAAFFTMAKVTRINITTLPQRKVKKFKIPKQNIPGGAILHMSYNGHTRGVIKSNEVKKNFWKHSISIDVSTDTENVSMKLSSGRIQMTGCRGRAHAKQACDFILRTIQKLQEEFEYIMSAPVETIIWLKESTRGDISSTDPPKHMLIKPDLTPTIGVDLRVVNFFLDFIDDYSSWESFVSLIDATTNNVEFVEKGDLSIIQNIPVMINYNYSLGFKIDRMKLAQAVQKYSDRSEPGQHSFIAHFNNQRKHYVTIEMPYDCEINPHIKRSRDVPCHTILVYRSGCVTLSGPREDMIEDVYGKFLEMITEIRDEIEIKDE